MTAMATANHYLCEVQNLSVLIVRDGEGYFAQGIEIDYAACGESLDDVKRRFARGFVMTITANLRKFGHLDKLFQPAPSNVRQEFEHQVDKLTFSQVSVHKIEAPEDALATLTRELSALSAIRYFEAQAEVAA